MKDWWETDKYVKKYLFLKFWGNKIWIKSTCRQNIWGFVRLAFFPGSKQSMPDKKKLKHFTVLKQKLIVDTCLSPT